ncbi:diguanylate cyclase [Marinimicrobium agarilyticum]|uniref:diguanylate cyclase n=1 Tax=Marinimicrobium agarilyticum TaxID=306546 RepID=UPI00040D1C49|nr:diguanylate cyclase [Marinimicrobium agarilyticum]
MDNSPTAETLVSAARLYFDTFLCHRDPKASAALASNRITGFGTGARERVYKVEQALDLYRMDVEAIPGPIEYSIRNIQAQGLTDDTGVVLGEMDCHFFHLNQAASLLNIRFTLVMRKLDGRWILEHKHLSQPSQAHEEHEGYPLKELEDRSQVLQRMVKERTRELEETNRQMQRLAITDVLTGLYNRMRTDETLDVEIERQKRYPAPLTLILMDIDHFKAVNDGHGHNRGDEVLVEVSRLLSQRVRRTDCLGRWGGEEFLLVCPNTSLESARQLADELRRAVAYQNFGVEVDITLSLGVAQYTAGDSRESLLERADAAMYNAKQEGRNRVSFSP